MPIQHGPLVSAGFRPSGPRNAAPREADSAEDRFLVPAHGERRDFTLSREQDEVTGQRHFISAD